MHQNTQSTTYFKPTPKLHTSLGPHGEFVVTRTYTNWRYRVTMRHDGAIQVRPGDWLSKYSAAIYNDFTHVHEFARMDKSGSLKPIHNLNLILAGETIYHVPTYQQAHTGKTNAVPV